MTNYRSTIDTLAAAVSRDAESVRGVSTATLVGFDEDGTPLLDIPGDPPRSEVRTLACVALTAEDVGKQVVILVDAGNQREPVVLGVIRPPAASRMVEISADGHGLTVRADESITLKCGDASITLKRDGKIVIRGKHVVTQASGVNRIRGGSVELN